MKSLPTKKIKHRSIQCIDRVWRVFTTNKQTFKVSPTSSVIAWFVCPCTPLSTPLVVCLSSQDQLFDWSREGHDSNLNDVFIWAAVARGGGGKKSVSEWKMSTHCQTIPALGWRRFPTAKGKMPALGQPAPAWGEQRKRHLGGVQKAYEEQPALLRRN